MSCFPYAAVIAAQRRISAALLTLLSKLSYQLLAEAAVLAQRGDTQFAVILAQAACEMHTEDAINTLVSRRKDAVPGNLVLDLARETMSLDSRRVYRVYSTLTDDYPKGHSERKLDPAPWWTAWKASRDLRHEVAHKGASATPEQAAAALRAAEQYMQHISAKVESALSLLPP